VAGLSVLTTPPVLIFGTANEAAGEVWLGNSTNAKLTIESAQLTVNFPAPDGTQSGTIALPPDPVVAPGATKRLTIHAGLSLFTAPGSHTAKIDLRTTESGAQSINATMKVARSAVVKIADPPILFTGVVANTTYSGEVVVLNRGNSQFTVGDIPDEAALEVVATPRVLSVATTGSVSVEPALGFTPGPTISFTNNKPTIDPGNWAAVQFQLTTPAAVTADRHFRVLPRVLTERFVIDLLT
jgi:hypothetical protein